MDEAADTPGIDRLLDCIDHPLFWTAEYLDDTPALPVLPLIFWLSDVFAPTTVHTEGPGSDVAHLAFCQAGARLGLDMQVGHAGEAGDRFAEARAAYGPLPAAAPGGPVEILTVSLTERDTPSLKDLAERVSEDGALLLYGPGLTDAILADVPATDMRPLIFGAADPLVCLLLGPGAPSPLSELAALPPDSTERQAVNRLLTRMGEMHRLELAARTSGTAPHAQPAQSPSRHAEDIERLLAKMIEMEEDRLALRRNRPATSATSGTDDVAVTALQDRLDGLEAELGISQQRTDDSERNLKAIRASTSWRITAPLRAVIRALRGRSRG